MTSWGWYCFVRNVELLGGCEVWKEVGVAGRWAAVVATVGVVERVLEEWLHFMHLQSCTGC